MSQLATFISLSGAFLAGMVVIAAAAFRSAAAPLWSKIVIPLMLLVLAFYTPSTINALLGSPRKVACQQLPQSFYILAISADDDRGIVDLFIRAGEEAQAYEVSLTPALADALRGLQLKLIHGPVHVLRSCDAGSSAHHQENSSVNEDGEAVLQDDAETPKKDAAE